MIVRHFQTPAICTRDKQKVNTMNDSHIILDNDVVSVSVIRKASDLLIIG